MNQTKAVAIFGGCVLAATIGLWVLLKGGGSTTPAAPPAPAPVEPAVSSTTPPPVAPALPHRDQPVVANAETPRESGESTAKVYDVGGRTVRDHRTGEHAPIDIPPAVHPAEGRRIAPTVTQGIAQKLRAKVVDCAAAIPAESRGDKPRVEGLMNIAIKDKQLTVSSSTMQIRGIEGAAADAAKQCIEAAALTVTDATTEADLASYDITVSYAL